VTIGERRWHGPSLFHKRFVNLNKYVLSPFGYDHHCFSNIDGETAPRTPRQHGHSCRKTCIEAEAALRAAYQGMVVDGLLMDEAEPFDRLKDACRTIQEKANVFRRGETSERQ
jgi:hypothetical protein